VTTASVSGVCARCGTLVNRAKYSQIPKWPVYEPRTTMKTAEGTPLIDSLDLGKLLASAQWRSLWQAHQSGHDSATGYPDLLHLSWCTAMTATPRKYHKRDCSADHWEISNICLASFDSVTRHGSIRIDVIFSSPCSCSQPLTRLETRAAEQIDKIRDMHEGHHLDPSRRTA
jgi:hypothetical protein